MKLIQRSKDKRQVNSPNDGLVARRTHHNGDCLLTKTGVMRFAEVLHVHRNLLLHPSSGAHGHVLALALKEEVAAIKGDVVRITRDHATSEALEVVRLTIPTPVLHALAVEDTHIRVGHVLLYVCKTKDVEVRRWLVII